MSINIWTRKQGVKLINYSLWAMGFAFMYISKDINTANHWRLLSTIGWCFFYSICTDFTISICMKKYMKNRLIKVILYLPSFIFYIHYASYSPKVVILKIYGGFGDIYPECFWGNIFALYSITSILACLYIFYNWGKKSNNIREKKQARIFLITAIVAFFLGKITDIILPNLGFVVYPCGILFLAILMGGAWYAITRYKMMTISHEYMADYIFKSVSNPIFLTDEHLNITKANDAALDLIGYKRKDIYNVSIKRLVQGAAEEFSRLYEEGSINNLEIQLDTKNVEEINCILSGDIVYDEFKEILGIIIILQDISHRKKAERMLLNYNSELEDKIRERTLELEAANNAKSEFLANVSHELRTPLNVIHSASQLFNMYLKDDTIYNKEDATRHLSSIRQNCLRLIRLVNNILDTTKLDARHFELQVRNYDFVDVIDRIVDSVSEYINQRGIKLEFITELDTKVIAFDINAIERIVLNLISNAIKFTRVNGSIVIRISEIDGFVKLSVKDDGIGIPEELHQAIFERFKQVNNGLTRQHEGSGLGLAITKTLVEMHGGKVYVRSKKDMGSEFIIELPTKVTDSVIENLNIQNENETLIEHIKVEFSDIYD